MVDQTASESRDGKEFSDRDVPYQWGHPLEGMNLWARMHLLQMRGKILDYKQGVRGGAADGDSAPEPLD